MTNVAICSFGLLVRTEGQRISDCLMFLFNILWEQCWLCSFMSFEMLMTYGLKFIVWYISGTMSARLEIKRQGASNFL
jgi:hypothetical protein